MLGLTCDPSSQSKGCDQIKQREITWIHQMPVLRTGDIKLTRDSPEECLKK